MPDLSPELTTDQKLQLREHQFKATALRTGLTNLVASANKEIAKIEAEINAIGEKFLDDVKEFAKGHGVDAEKTSFNADTLAFHPTVPPTPEVK